MAPVERADGIRLHLPHLERHIDLVLALAELHLVVATHQLDFEAALNSRVRYFLEIARPLTFNFV
jgi:hypothetical protein